MKKKKSKQRIKQLLTPHPDDVEIDLHVARTQHIMNIIGTLNAISHRVDDIWDYLRAQRERRERKTKGR